MERLSYLLLYEPVKAIKNKYHSISAFLIDFERFLVIMVYIERLSDGELFAAIKNVYDQFGAIRGDFD